MARKGQYKTYGMINSLYGYIPIIHATDAMMRKRGYVHVGYTANHKNYYMYNVFTNGVEYYATLDRYTRKTEHNELYKPKRRLSKTYPKRHFVTDYNIRLLKMDVQGNKSGYKKKLANCSVGYGGITKADVERSLSDIEDSERRYRQYVKRKNNGRK